MDFITEVFSIGIVFFALGVVAISHVIRVIAQNIYPKFRDKDTRLGKFYNELILESLPALVGGLLAFCMPMYNYPSMFTSTGSHILYGIGTGLVSGLFYKWVKKTVFSSLGKKAPDSTVDSTAVPPSSEPKE